MLDTRVLDQIAVESRAAHVRADERRLLGSALADLVGETIARPCEPDATYAVSGKRLNRIVLDLSRAAAQLDASARYLTERGRETFAAQCSAHAARLRETRDLVTAHAAVIA